MINLSTGGIGFGLYIATGPSVTRTIVNKAGSSNINVRLTSSLTLEVYNDTTLLGTSYALTTGRWYWVGMRIEAGTDVAFLQIDGSDAVIATATPASASLQAIGCSDTEASAIDIYIDDIVLDNAQIPQPHRVNLLLPISDNSRTNWTAGAGGTTNLFAGVDNNPPGGLASASETNTSNIESASNTGTANYVANMTTYATAGVGPRDVVTGVIPFIRQGEDISTGTKTGSFEVTSNPVIGATTFTFGGNAGAHGEEATGAWLTTTAASVTASPSVAIASSPTMKVTKTDTTTRTGCISLMAMYVCWRPAGGSIRTVLQAVNRSAVI
jgi:hypothetical protein